MDEADLVVLNTCHIREKASEKVFSELGRLRELRDERRAAGADLMIGVAGCVAQAEGEEIVRRAPVGRPGVRAAELSPPARADRPGRATAPWSSIPSFPQEDKFEHLPAASQGSDASARGLTAFLTVQEGCDKFCSFCVVPYTRGAEASAGRSSRCWPRPAAWSKPGCGTHPARPERQCLPWARRARAAAVGLGRTLLPAGRDPGPRTRMRYTTCTRST